MRRRLRRKIIATPPIVKRATVPGSGVTTKVAWIVAVSPAVSRALSSIPMLEDIGGPISDGIGVPNSSGEIPLAVVPYTPVMKDCGESMSDS